MVLLALALADYSWIIISNNKITGSVLVTEAVPKYSSGQQVTNFATAFNIETNGVSDGNITLTLAENPVYLEQY